MTDAEIAEMAGISVYKHGKEGYPGPWAYRATYPIRTNCCGYKTEAAATKAAAESVFYSTKPELSKLCLKLLRKHKLKAKPNRKNHENTDTTAIAGSLTT